MCECNSQWAQNANNFLQQNAANLDAMYQVVYYLYINNKCGRENGVYLNDILDYVNNNGYNYNRESFQHEILIPLKRQNILVSLPYPGNSGGIFIPCNIVEIEQAYKQVLNRVLSELNNINYIVNSLPSIANLNNIIELIRREIDNL